MDGENNGKPYEQMDDLGGFPTPIFGNTHIWKNYKDQVGFDISTDECFDKRVPLSRRFHILDRWKKWGTTFSTPKSHGKHPYLHHGNLRYPPQSYTPKK